MLSDNMRKILLLALSSQRDIYPEEHATQCLMALKRKGLLKIDDDEYIITPKGYSALGISRSIKAKRPKTIIRKVFQALYGEDIPLLKTSAIPMMAAEEDHLNDSISWYDWADALCAIEYYNDEEISICAEIACDYTKKWDLISILKRFTICLSSTKKTDITFCTKIFALTQTRIDLCLYHIENALINA